MSVVDQVSLPSNPIALPPPTTSSRNWIGWAIYLATSWTWCIGMFLPVLLVRDFGTWAWVVFAVPNVIGAAAMGWFVRDRSSSEAIGQNHAVALCFFSLATMVFQAFFVTWWLGTNWPVAGAIGAFVLLVAATVALDARISAPLVALGVYLFSFGVFALALWRHEIPYFDRAGSVVPGPIAALAVVCCFGFGLCPYLDLTFHHARRRTGIAGGRAAFGVGFVVFFLVMILFSLTYSGWFIARLRHWGGAYPPIVWTLIGWHLLAQCAYTSGVHFNQLVRQRLVRGGVPLAAIVIGLAIGTFAIDRREDYYSFSFGENVYRVFIGFYGLIFPAYVWLCMIPGRGRVAPSKRQLIVLAIAVLLAAPMFWMGFIEKQMVWLLPGVGLILLARLFIRTRDYAPAAAL